MKTWTRSPGGRSPANRAVERVGCKPPAGVAAGLEAEQEQGEVYVHRLDRRGQDALVDFAVLGTDEDLDESFIHVDARGEPDLAGLGIDAHVLNRIGIGAGLLDSGVASREYPARNLLAKRRHFGSLVRGFGRTKECEHEREACYGGEKSLLGGFFFQGPGMVHERGGAIQKAIAIRA